MTFDQILKKVNNGHNSFMLRGRAFMFGMGIPYDKAFQTVR